MTQPYNSGNLTIPNDMAQRLGQRAFSHEFRTSPDASSTEYSNLTSLESPDFLDPTSSLQSSFHLERRDADARSTSPEFVNYSSTECKSLPGLHQTGGSTTFSHDGPFLVILEEPTHRIRYRYRSEKGSHGGLTGENSSQAKKTYPAVRLENHYDDREVVVKASLVTSDSSLRPHVHKLMGKNCTEDGHCFVPLDQEDRTAVFQNLGILFVGKKEVPEILLRRKLAERLVSGNGGQLTDDEENSLREEAEREAKGINLNSVRVAWEALDKVVNYRICAPVYSRSIANQKSPDSGELKIIRIDRSGGDVSGDEEVFLLCEKVNRKEIRVRFFELDKAGNQVAIVFKTPAYRDQNITHPVQVQLQLFRPKDGEFSESRPFTYFPREAIGKRRRCFPASSQQFSMFQGHSSCEAPVQSHAHQSPLFEPYTAP